MRLDLTSETVRFRWSGQALSVRRENNLKPRIFGTIYLVVGAMVPFTFLAFDGLSSAGNDFKTLMKQAHDRPEDLDFTALRLLWAEEDKYDPYVDFSERYQRTISALTKALETKQYGDAIKLCKKTENLYQLDIKWNLECQEVYEGAGVAETAEFHYFMAMGLFRSIMNSGDGESTKTAYKVITGAEQYAVMDVLGVSKMDQSLVEIDGVRYDRITVKDNESGEERRLYFQVESMLAWIDRN